MRSLLPIVLLAGCPSKTVPSADPPVPTTESPAPAIAEAVAEPAPTPPSPECIETCMHASMAEARSPEAIRADCEAACGTGAPVLVSTAGELALMGGKRIEARGLVKQGDHPSGGQGTYLGLPDGAKLWISAKGIPDGWEGLVGQQVSVVGTLDQGPPPHLNEAEAPVRIGEEPPRRGDAPL